MNDGSRGIFGRSRCAGALTVASAAAAVLIVACGGTRSPPASAQSKNYPKALAFVECMRTHGQPTFPDPTSQGIVSANQAKITPGILASYQQCRTLLPPGLLLLTEAQREQLTTQALKRAACMPGTRHPSRLPGGLTPRCA